MANSIFAVGFSPVDDGRGNKHVFGGLVEGRAAGASIVCGLDYGTDIYTGHLSPALFDGDLDTTDTSALFLLPVSERSAHLFKTLARNLHELKKHDRFPFYFSRSGEEQSNPKGEDAPQFPDVPERKAANCFTFFNFAARASGIDLAALSSEWHQHKHAEKIKDVLQAGVQDFTATQIECDYDDGADLWSCRTEKGIVMEAQDNARPLVREFLRSASGRMFENFGALRRHFEALRPLACPPEKPPLHVQQELDRLPL